ncbi:hypothetical protein [Vibrio gangliei]|uniref:hypothetical protein n=1 Tax=Vibrio gangliei TaxID=2077090 RepID=UPI0013001C7C|nr:hypothetical protein [Vibrio gangliei]
MNHKKHIHHLTVEGGSISIPIKKHSKKTSIYWALSIVFISIGTWLIAVNKPASLTNVTRQQENQIQAQNEQDTNTHQLSENISYPSPVQQLQQSVTQGLIKTSNPKLPLLKGDLETFATSNITQEYEPTDELVELKLKLKRLESLSSSGQ